MRNLVFGEYKLGLESFNKEVSFIGDKNIFWILAIAIGVRAWSVCVVKSNQK